MESSSVRRLSRPPDDRLVGAIEVAQLLSVSTRTVWRLRDSGVLQAVRIGRGLVRFRESEIQRLVRTGFVG